jgi:hypothetical protein
MNTCKDCKWYCLFNKRVMICNNTEVWDKIFQATNIEERLKYFMPSPDFGCIHWKAKESEDALP